MLIAKLYAIALPVFLLIDMIWLGVVAKSFYAKHIGDLMKSPPNWAAALLFYAIFIGGLVAFVIEPAVSRGQWQYALGMGALFGIVCYATYDLTSQAVIKDWPVIVTVVDMAWGATIASVVSIVTYLIATRFMT